MSAGEAGVAPAAGASAAPGRGAVLTIDGLVKRWPREQRRVLAGVDLEVAPGEVVWVGGDNGAGKTTLLRVIAGLLIPDAGEVRLLGLHPERDRREYQRRLGFVSAGNAGLYARMTVSQHLDFWGRMALVPRRERDDAVARAIGQLSLGELAARRCDRMSMGQRQRVRLAMAFLHDPSLILLDEPRNSLDSDGTAALGEAVRAHTERGGAVIWCSPVGEPVGYEIDRGFLMVDGLLRAE